MSFHILTMLMLLVSCIAVLDESQFDWHIYLELNPSAAEDIVFKTHPVGQGKKIRSTHSITAEEAIAHYESLQQHYHQSASVMPQYRRPQPMVAEWKAATQKMQLHCATSKCNSSASSTLVLYHIEDILLSDTSIEVVRNNIKIFTASIIESMNTTHQSSESIQSNSINVQSKQRCVFYLFLVAVSAIDDQFFESLPVHLSNAAAVRWPSASVTAPAPALMYHIEALRLLVADSEYATAGLPFDAVFCTGSSARGPLLPTDAPFWVDFFRTVLHREAQLALVSPIVQKEKCDDIDDRSIRVQSHAFMLRLQAPVTQAVLKMAEQYSATDTFTPFTEYFELHIGEALAAANWKIASLLHHARGMDAVISADAALTGRSSLCPYFSDSDTKAATNDYSGHRGSIQGCNVGADEGIFQHWSGASLSDDSHLCSAGITAQQQVAWSESSTQAHDARVGAKSRLLSAEALPGGIIKELRREYLLENSDFLYNTSYRQPLHMQHRSYDASGGGGNVCFLVRTAASQDPTTANVQSTPNMPQYRFEDVKLDGLIQC